MGCERAIAECTIHIKKSRNTIFEEISIGNHTGDCDS